MTQETTYDQEAALDRKVCQHGAVLTVGAAALHPLDPAEVVMRLEEWDAAEWAESERWALGVEVLRGFLEYAFADGPAPREVRARVGGFLAARGVEHVRGRREWVSARRVDAVLEKYAGKLSAVRAAASGRGALGQWCAELEAEEDGEMVRRTLDAIAGLLMRNGHGEWRKITAVVFGLAKALRPELIAGMSLHEIAVLSGDKGGRATPQNRIKRILRDQVREAGHREIQVHFQKSASAAEKARAAAMGKHKPKPMRRKEA